MAKQRLTDKTLTNSVSLDDLIHIVKTGDTTQNPAGSSYKATVSSVVATLSASTVTGLTFDNFSYDLTLSLDNGNTFTDNLGILASDIKVTGGTYDSSTGDMTFTNNSGGTFVVNGVIFTGNTSASCVTDLYVSNLYGCSPITIHDILQSTQTPFAGFGSVTLNDGSGGLILNSDSFLEGINAKLQTGNGTGYNTFEVEQISGGDGYLKIYVNDLNASFTDRNQTYIVSKNNPNPFTTRLELASNSITADRTWTMPNNTGTVALISDIVNTYVTGGTYSSGTATFTNNSGGTFDVTGFISGDTNIANTDLALTFNRSIDMNGWLFGMYDGAGLDGFGPTISFEGALAAEPKLSLGHGYYINPTSNNTILDIGVKNGKTGFTFSTNSVEKVIIDINGDVGIGTTSPSEKLHVSGNTKISGSLNIGNVLGNTPIGNLGFDSSGNVVTGTTGSVSDIFVTGGTFDNNTDTITFTNTSGGTFDVTGITDTNFANTNLTFTGSRDHDTNGNYLSITTDNGGYNEGWIYLDKTGVNQGSWIGYASNYVRSYNTGTEIFSSDGILTNRVAFTSGNTTFNTNTVPGVGFIVKTNVDPSSLIVNGTSGYVGVGTNSPTEKLHISGNTKISGSLNIGNILGNTPIGNLGFDSSGNVVTGTTGSGAGVFGISNSLGVYTYYSTLQSAINASNSGDTIQMFADVLETSATTVNLKDGVDINMNGYTYTLSQASSDQCLSDNNVAVNCKIYNGNIIRSGSTYVNDVTSLCLYIQNSSSVIETSGVYFTTTTTTGINNNGTIKGAIINAYTRGIVNSGKIYSVNATTTLETAIYCNTTTSEVYDSIGRSNGAGYGIGMLIPSFNGSLKNSVGYSLGNAGIYAVNLSTMQSCVGYSVSNNGISVTASIVHDCKGYSSGSIGLNLQNIILGTNVLGYSFTSQGVLVGVPTNLVDSVIDNLTSTSATNSGCALSASGTATLTVKNIQATSLLSGGLGYACTVGGNNNIRIMGGSLDVVNSAVCLYSSSPITVRYANLIFKTSASPEVDANITQGITTPIDSYGNINVLT